jgi:acyl carrier protein
VSRPAISKEEILARVSQLIAESFELDPAEVLPTADLREDLDLDSIDAIDLVVGLEEEIGLEVSEDELREIKVVQDIVDLIHHALQGG